MQRYFPSEAQDLTREIESWYGILDAAFAIVAVGLVVVAVLMVLQAVGSFLFTRYRIYERRVDIESGVVKRGINSIWMYEVVDVSYQQPLFLLLTGTAQILLQTERGKKPFRITGVAGPKEMREMWDIFRNATLAQRRDMKGIWV
jgi:uncharacterized membrane protein YdbT with pleckstrin-like domain